MALKLPAPPPPQEDFPELSDWLNKVVVLLPTEETTVTTRGYGDRPMTKTVAWGYDEIKGELESIGDCGVFWGKVRAQLHDSIGEYVVGRLVKDGRAYVLSEEVPADVVKAIESEFDF